MTCIFRTVSTTICGLFLSALSVVAQDALSQDTGTGSAGAVQLLVENHAAASVELSQYGPDGALVDSDVLEELEQGELEVPAGTRLEASLHDPDTPATERHVFMTYTVSETPAAQVMKIPDPLLLEPVGLTFRNGGPVRVELWQLDDSAENGVVLIGGFDSGDEKKFSVLPETILTAHAVDGSVHAIYKVSLDVEQVFDIDAYIAAIGPTVPLRVMNFTAQDVTVEEHVADAVVRLAALGGEQEITVDAVVGSTITIVHNATPARLIATHTVGEGLNQRIEVFHDAELARAISKIPEAALERLTAERRAAALKFVESTRAIVDSNPDAVAYVLANTGDEAVWVATHAEGVLSQMRKIEAGETLHTLGRTGRDMVLWPDSAGGAKPSTPEDVFLRYTNVRQMPRFVDASSPARVETTLVNTTCRPLDVTLANPFGTNTAPRRLRALDGTLVVNGYEGTAIAARLSAEANNAGNLFWSGILGTNDGDTLQVAVDTSIAHDPIDRPRVPEAAEGEEPPVVTVFMSNDTSRPMDVYLIAENGRQIRLTHENKPVTIAPRSSHSQEVFEGSALVFNRPDAKAARSEYGRYRVTAAPNQRFDIGGLRHARLRPVGAWVPQADALTATVNAFGTRFLNLQDRGDGRVIGSSNLYNGDLDASARFEGCVAGDEGYGLWFPSGFENKCETPVTDAAGHERTSYGRYQTVLSDGVLTLSQGYCDAPMDVTSTWVAQPEHYDDMDPDTEGLTHGMMETAWAPPSFEWLGRGYNLLYADPMNFSSTEEPRAYSERPIFRFVFQNPEGTVGDSVAKQIFGVNHVNQNAASSACDETETVIHTMADYQKFNAKSYGGSIGVPAVGSFSMSKSHSEMNNGATGKDKVYLMERCDLRLDELIMDTRWTDQSGVDHMRQPLDPAFRDAVARLPTEFGDGKALLNFIQRFGTHFAERIVYGGTFYAKTTISKETYQKGVQTSDGLEVGGSATIKKVQLGGHFKNEKTEGRNNENEHSNSQYEKFSVGGDGSKIYESWKDAVAKERQRAPIEVRFRPIYDVLTTVYFPDDPLIGEKNRLVRAGLKTYFRQFAGIDLTAENADHLRAQRLRDPRQVCVRAEALAVKTSVPSSGGYGGKIEVALLDRNGTKKTEDRVIALGIEADKAFRKRKDGMMTMAISEGELLTYDKYAQFGWLREQCFEASREDYAWNGSVCVKGTFHINDSAADRWTGNCQFNPIKHNFDALERGIPVAVTGSLATATSQVEYKLKIYVP